MRNRLQILFLLFILAILCFYVSMQLSPNFMKWMRICVSLSAIFIAIFIFFENRDPSRTLAWLVVLVVFPVIGFFFYLFFGQSYRKKRRYHQNFFSNMNLHYAQTRSDIQSNVDGNFKNAHYEKVLRLSSKLSPASAFIYTESRILTNGAETFASILNALEQAKHHIHLAYYIVRNDRLGNELKEILIRKAKEGVRIRFLYDAVGSMKLNRGYVRELQENGVHILPFSPIRLFDLGSPNYRNHRKIIVVDGQIGFVGGLNIGDEYLGRVKHFGFWRDTHVMLDGLAIRNLQMIFLQDWIFTSKEPLLDETIYFQTEKRKTDGLIQVIAGGPDTKQKEIKHIFLSMISSARKSIYIASPYFIPDEDVYSALKIAALGGVDVKILFPFYPDKKFVFYASRSYFSELLQAGVRIFQYTRGFMHSKFIIVDGKIASIGTANMDMRSFHLNFEINVFLYFSSSVHHLEEVFMDDLVESTELTLSELEKRTLKERILESFCRLFSPLL